jgi:hypothetical protein
MQRHISPGGPALDRFERRAYLILFQEPSLYDLSQLLPTRSLDEGIVSGAQVGMLAGIKVVDFAHRMKADAYRLGVCKVFLLLVSSSLRHSHLAASQAYTGSAASWAFNAHILGATRATELGWDGTFVLKRSSDENNFLAVILVQPFVHFDVVYHQATAICVLAKVSFKDA